MKKIIGIILVCFMVLQILSVFILPISAKFIDDVPELFWHGNSKIKKEYNENKIQFKEYSHLLTQEEMNQLKKRVGVYDKNKNYNIKYNELGTGLAPPSNEEWNVMVGTVNVVDNNLPNLPSATSIDLSTESYFPIVRSQGSQGSCAAWAATYYANGYVQAKDNGWNEASIGNNNHLLSPAFTYNKCNNGGDSGSHTWTNGYVMQDVGVCTWSEMPYNSGDDINWGNENAWRDAPSYRISDIFMIDSYPANYDDSDINIIKNAVESGYPVTFALNANSYNNFGSDDVLGLNAMLTSYNHANTIVGYDDTITDSESGEIGAFKCVNSWGSSWGPNNNGYYWMTYNAFKGSQNVYPVCWFGDLYTDSDPKLLGVWELNPQSDRDANIELGIGSYSSPLGTRTPWWDGHSGTMHSYPSFMCLDITEFYNDWISNSNNFYLEFGNSLYNDGTISSFKIEYYDISYITGSPTQISPESGDVPLTTPGYVETQLLQTETNFPPSCTLTANPSSGEAPLTTTFSMSANDPDGSIASWELDVDNDGTAEYSISGNPTTQQHIYTNPGVYNVELTVWDDFGATATDTTIVTVTGPNTPPDAQINPNPVNGATDVGVSPTLSVYVNDNEGDTMTVTFYEDGEGSIGTDTVSGSGTASYVWSAANEYSTTYSWYAVADDEEYQTQSDTWSFTTESTPPQRFYANQDIQVQNGGISGSYASTFTSKNIYEEIREAKTGPMSKLQHKWTIPVDAGYGSYIFSIEAYHTSNGEGDNFIFAYSTDDITYTDMLTVTKTSDNNAYQTYALPTDLSGNVYIRVVDTDQTKGNNLQDIIFVDHMFIEVSGTPPPNRAPNAPINPDPVNEATDVSTSPTLSVYVEDPDGDTMDVTFINAVTLTDIGTAYGVPSGSRASFDWLDLTAETPYSWHAVASDTEYSTDSDIWSFTTGSELPPGGVYVWNITWREKTAGKNTFLYYTVWVKIDSNSNGIAEETDDPASSATVYPTLTNLAGGSWDHSGLTDSNGQIEFGEKVGSGEYMAEVINIVLSGYTYNSGMDINNPSYHTLP